MTTHTDRELLELAAKAAGIDFRPGVGGGIWIPAGSHLQREWNPLIDDGDALRLAVKLGISSGPDYDEAAAVAFARDSSDFQEPNGSDPYTATRRAIVRAAAEIGRAKP